LDSRPLPTLAAHGGVVVFELSLNRLFVILWIIELVARFKNIVYLVIAIGIGIGFYFIHRNLLKTEKNNSVKPPLYHGGVRGRGRFNGRQA
jgi:positive regulator of sigma E activity